MNEKSDKHDHAHYLEHTNTNNTDNGLDKIETRGTVVTEATFDIDPENRLALKGDQSDGKVDWTKKQIIATISLAMIYTGNPLLAMSLSL